MKQEKRKRTFTETDTISKKTKADNENFLRIDGDFLNSLKYQLPFTIKVYKNQVFYVLVNPVFCQVFWTKFIHDRFSVAFKRQNMISVGESDNMDLTLQVWINRDTLELYKPPSFITSVMYFNSMIDSNESISFLKYKSQTVRNIGISSLAIVGVVGAFLPNII